MSKITEIKGIQMVSDFTVEPMHTIDGGVCYKHMKVLNHSTIGSGVRSNLNEWVNRWMTCE